MPTTLGRANASFVLAGWVGLALVCAAHASGAELSAEVRTELRTEAPAELFAEQLTAKNFETRRLGGVDAIAGLGDYVLGNGVVCAAVSAPEHESTLSDRGGILIDLGHCGRDDDQWGVLQPMLNLSRESTLSVSEVTAAVVDGTARVEASGRAGGLAYTTIHSLDEREPDRLRIETRVERFGEGEALFLLGDVVLHGHRQLTPFTLSGQQPHHSVGFDHPAIEIESAVSMVDAMVRADTQVLVGGSQLEPGISYGWRIVDAYVLRRDGSRDDLAHLALNGEHFSILGVYADTLVFGGTERPGMMELAQTLLMDLEPGEQLVYAREIVLGQRADVASVTDRFWSDGPVVVGRVSDPAARLHVFDAKGAPVTFVRPASDGAFTFRLPAERRGGYEVRVQRGDDVAATRQISVTSGTSPVDLGLVTTGAASELLLPEGEVMRLVFEGLGDTPDPIFGGDGLTFMVGDERVRSSTESNDLLLAGVSSDPKRVRLPPGRYRVLATRGPEWSVSQTELNLEAGQRKPLVIEPPLRVVDWPGWVSADFHVHAAASDDSALPVRTRIASFVAQGADVIVATDHDQVFDYGPTIASMGLADRLTSMVGVEMTSTVIGSVTPFTSGHANAFPLVPQRQAYRGGAPSAENRRLRDIVAAVRERPGRPVVQLNHPRESGADRELGSYLSHLAVAGEPFDPTAPLDAQANEAFSERSADSGLRDLDFDLIELLNGSSMNAYRLTRGDWFSLLLQGERRTGTANSDSHSSGHPVALPRSHVAYAGGLGRDFDEPAFMAAVRGGRVVGSTGPLLDARLGAAGPGERFVGTEGELVVSVQHADWVPVDEIRVFVNGAIAVRGPVGANGMWRTSLRFADDSFVTVEVEGRAEPGSIYAAVAPGYTPFAFTNPILVDADGDGEWTAPGLPKTPPPTLADPLASP